MPAYSNTPLMLELLGRACSFAAVCLEACDLGRLGKQGQKPTLPFGNPLLLGTKSSVQVAALLCAHIVQSMYVYGEGTDSRIALRT